MDYSPLDSSVHGILQARILERVAMPSSKRSSQPRERIWVSCIAGRVFTIWATREPTAWLGVHQTSDLSFILDFCFINSASPGCSVLKALWHAFPLNVRRSSLSSVFSPYCGNKKSHDLQSEASPSQDFLQIILISPLRDLSVWDQRTVDCTYEFPQESQVFCFVHIWNYYSEKVAIGFIQLPKASVAQERRRNPITAVVP